ncbi:MAG: ribonuclease HII, partial [Methylococcales bacterium]|nr:ribonuclease HII [Methylococcales bacterium]
MCVDLDTSIVAGIDEVGRGCIAGPVVAAIVILDPANPIAGLKDSKTISPRRRTLLSHCILEKALDWSIGRAEVSEITSINILQATLLAMQRAYQGLHITPDWVW